MEIPPLPLPLTAEEKLLVYEYVGFEDNNENEKITPAHEAAMQKDLDISNYFSKYYDLCPGKNWSDFPYNGTLESYR
jgi:hypothetical protein